MGQNTKKLKMELSIIIISYNTREILISCLKSIKKHTKGVKYEVIVVDNASTDGSAKASEDLGAIVIKNKSNLGFAAGNNQGVRVSKGKYILFLNSDTVIEENVLGEMISFLDKNPKIGAATSALRNKDRSLQATGGYFPTLLRVFSWMTIQDLPFVDMIIKPFHPFHSKSFFFKGDEFYSKKKELDWVTGAFLMTRKSVIEATGGWDESFFMYVEEVDFCYRIKELGYEIWYLPKWKIIHLGGASSKTSEFSLISEYNGIKKFYKKHYPFWQYPILRFLLKLGAFGRIILFGILEGKEAAKVYAKAFKTA